MRSNTVKRQSRRQVLLLFGGESSEHEVSVLSASNVHAAIDKSLFDVLLGYIDRQGQWWLAEEVTGVLPPNAERLVPLLGDKSFMTEPGGDIIAPDVILPILHGRNGEDGSVQALGQLLHIPIVGCDMTASAICMDKVATKEILSANDIPNAPYRVHRIGEADPNYKVLKEQLGATLFVKPARSGSSVGVSKVTSADELADALRLAHEHDSTILIEMAIAGRELEVAVLGNPPHHEASGVGEIIAGDDFYSYDAKYSADSRSQAVIPADIDGALAGRIRTLAHQAHTVLGCRGMARVDFFLDDEDTIYVNEVNTIPGFTNISMYPKLWQQEGVSYQELITRLILEALDGTM